MEEANLMGFSGGFEQGKLEAALLETPTNHNNKTKTGQFKFHKEMRIQLKNLKKNSSGKNKFYLSIIWFNFLILSLGLAGSAAAQEPGGALDLKQTIAMAIQANLGLKSSKEDTLAASALKKAQRTRFFPTFSANYQYTRHDEERRQLGVGVTRPENEYSFSASLSQPIFTGFALLNQYEIAKLGLDAAKINEKLKRQDVILEAKTTYFLLLRTQKLLNIAKDTVKQISAQKEVARNFYQVGMTPLNDLLQAQVELANANQDVIVARNNLDNAKSDFNLLLRRQIDAPVQVIDILDYASYVNDLDYCIAEAEKNRPEIVITKLDMEKAQKELKLARKDYYPTVTLNGTYFRQGAEWYVDGGEGIFAPDGWDISAEASWNFWEWGKTTYGIKEKRSRLSQSQIQQKNIIDQIQLEVKTAYLKTQEAEKAIKTVEKAIEQAKENLRINQERYKEQVATSTDVTIAQTLLSRTMTNYYSALYAFKIAKASLYRAMGQEVME